MVFLAVLQSKRSEGILESVTMNEENTQWVEAIKWMKGDLKKVLRLQRRISWLSEGTIFVRIGLGILGVYLI